MAKELGFNITPELVTSETVDGGQKFSDQETGCRKEGEDRGSPAVENTSESQREQPVEETFISANGHAEEPAEQNQHEDSDRAASDAEVKIVNGESEVRATGEGSETSTANGEIKSDATADEMKSESAEVNGEINGALDIPTSPSVLKSKGTWADVVSKVSVVNGTGDKDTAVNGVADNVSANGVAEE